MPFQRHQEHWGNWEISGYLGIVILKIIDFFCPYFFSKWIKINNRPSKVWCSKTPAGIFDFRWDSHLYVYLFSNFPNVMNKTWLGVIKNGPIRTSGTFSKQVGTSLPYVMANTALADTVILCFEWLLVCLFVCNQSHYREVPWWGVSNGARHNWKCFLANFFF